MFEVKIETHFSSAHHLLNYKGACENQHGHNWKVEVYVRGEELDKSEKIQDNSADGEALEAAKSMIEELETKLGNAQDELTRLNSEIAAINNRATQAEDLPKYDATAVFGELFNKAKQEV